MTVVAAPDIERPLGIEIPAMLLARADAVIKWK
jgi:hypothetical protein